MLRYAWLLVALGIVPTAAQAAAARPNVVLIVVDDLGYADLGVHGGKDIPTPHVDSIAKNGVRFTQAYVTTPLCSPSRAGLLTGRYPQRFGYQFNPDDNLPTRKGGLPLSQTTLATRLGDAGYVTGLVGKWHLGGDPGQTPNERASASSSAFCRAASRTFRSRGGAGS